MHPSSNIVNSIVQSLVSKFGYDNVVQMKDTIGMIGGILLGLMIGVIITAFVVKDAMYVPDGKADTIKVTEMIKNKKHKLFVIVPLKQFPNLSISTVIVTFLQALAVRVLPIDHLQFVNSKKIRIVTSIFILLLVVISIWCIYFDFHAIITDGAHKVKVYRIVP